MITNGRIFDFSTFRTVGRQPRVFLGGFPMLTNDIILRRIIRIMSSGSGLKERERYVVWTSKRLSNLLGISSRALVLVTEAM